MKNFNNLDLANLDLKHLNTEEQLQQTTLFKDVTNDKNKSNIEKIKPNDSLKINSSKPATVLSLKDISKKLLSIKKDMNSIFMERKDIINSIILAVVSKQHILLVGLPGTGKSFLIDNFTQRIEGINLFNWQLTKTTDPSELFGPISIKDMEKDKFRRKTEGTLLDSQFGYLDEVFKANSAILNSLLQLMNERNFNNDGQRIKCPLLTIFASSNEWGEDESLDAFTDRFVFKHEVKYISNNENLIKLLKNKVNGIKNNYTEKLTLDEINFLHSEVDKATIPEEVIKTLSEMIYALKTSGSTISDRKACQCLDIMKANAVLNNRNKVSSLDFGSLVYVLWDGKSNVEKIKILIQTYISPYIKRYEDFSKDYNSIIRKFFKGNTAKAQKDFIADNMQSISHIITLITDILNAMNTDDVLYPNFKEMLDSCDRFKNYLVNFISGIGAKKTQKDFLIPTEVSI